MRTLLIATDKIFYKTKDEYFTTGGFLYQIGGFFDYFDNIEIITRVQSINNRKDSLLKVDPRIKVHDLESNYKNPISLLKNIIKIFTITRKDNIYFHLRLPSSTGFLTGLLCLDKENVKIYIGGHPKNGILNTKGRNIKNLLISNISAFITNILVKNHETYVTGQELEMYFLQNNLRVNRIISSTVKEDEIINIPKTLKKDKKIELVFVGRLSSEKGLIFLIDSLSMIKSDVCLNIVGEGVQEEELRNYVLKKGLNDKVIFHGGIYSRKQLYNLLDKMDIFVLTSLTEGTPKVLIESMARGVPIISSNAGGIPSVIKHEYNGLLFNVNNQEEFLMNFNRLINDSELYNKMSKNGIDFARENSVDKLNEILMNYD